MIRRAFIKNAKLQVRQKDRIAWKIHHNFYPPKPHFATLYVLASWKVFEKMIDSEIESVMMAFRCYH